MEEGMVSAFALGTFWDHSTIWSDVALFEANEAKAEFISLVDSLVDGHLRQDVARFRFVDGFAHVAFVGRLRLLPSLSHGAVERRFPVWRNVVGIDVKILRRFFRIAGGGLVGFRRNHRRFHGFRRQCGAS